MAAAGQSRGFSVKLSTFSTPLEFQQIAAVIKSQLKAINIEVEIVAQEPGTFAANNGVGNFEWDLTARGMRGDVDGYLNEYNPVIPSYRAWYPLWKNVKVWRLVGNGKIVLDPAKRLPMYKQAQVLLQSELPQIGTHPGQQVPGRAQARPGHVRRVQRLQHRVAGHGVAQLVTEASPAGREGCRQGAPPGRMFCATIR